MFYEQSNRKVCYLLDPSILDKQPVNVTDDSNQKVTDPLPQQPVASLLEKNNNDRQQ